MIGIDGQKIRELRNSKNMTAKQLAEIARCKDGYLLQIERGEVRPSWKLLDRIAAALNVCTDDLLRSTHSLSSVDVKLDNISEMLLRNLLAQGSPMTLHIADNDFVIPDDLREPILRAVLAQIKDQG